MFEMKVGKIFILAALVAVLSSCGNFNKIMQSSDSEFKYKKALEYYESKDYNKAIALYGDLVRIYRGTSKADDIYYYYAKSFMGQHDYVLAGHYFNTLTKEYPRSEYAEEAQYMVGYCYYLDSPKPRLDQTVSAQSIESLQLFINLYPMSERVEEANRLIDELQDKLVYKSYLSAKLYFDLGHFKASVVALGNSLEDYPDTKYRLELKYLLLESKYWLAIRSIPSLKKQRMNDALDEYFAFVDEYPDSEYKKEVTDFHNDVAKYLGIKEDSN
ncbi:outer membrane protein assembly factor BamD [Puteibacter caeruleilacunae]|nr:outer membrane protein assembly factor BamD [Puteibacter caeruleilacunae]